MALLGMIGSGSFQADERPKNWLQGINLIFPNGDVPLTAILSMQPEKRVNDSEYNWFEKGLPIKEALVFGAETPHSGTVTAGADLTAGDAATGATVGILVADASIFEPGDIIQNMTTEELLLVTVVNTTTNEITALANYGAKFASGRAFVGVATPGAGADQILVVGSGSPEGATSKSSHLYAPTRHYNYTQIFRNSYEITRTALRTALRTDPNGPMTEAQRDAFQQHCLDIERALLLSERLESTSVSGGTGNLTGVSAGRPIRTTRGFLNWLPAVSTSATTPSVNWDIGTANSGNITEDIVDAFCEEVFRYGSSEKLVLCGGTFLNAFNKLAKTRFTINAVPTDQTYGLGLVRYTTPFGDLLLRQHPLLSHNATLRKDAFVIDPAFVELVVLEDTEHRENIQAVDADAVKGEFLTEAGLRMFYTGAAAATGGGLAATASPPAHGRLKGVTGFAG
jgi:hypothetical protein